MSKFYSFAIEDLNRRRSLSRHKAASKYYGVVRNRVSTDVVFLLIFIALWAIIAWIGSVAANGQPWRLVAGTDTHGNVCGYSASTQKQPFFYSIASGRGVCVDTCPIYDATITSTNSYNYYCEDWVSKINLIRVSYIMTTYHYP